MDEIDVFDILYVIAQKNQSSFPNICKKITSLISLESELSEALDKNMFVLAEKKLNDIKSLIGENHPIYLKHSTLIKFMKG